MNDQKPNYQDGIGLAAAPGSVDIVRLKTTAYKDKRGAIHRKTSIIPMRRLSVGYSLVDEDADQIGADEIFPRIENLNECKDGLYQVVMVNISRDWETGTIDDYDYRLVLPNTEASDVPTKSSTGENNL